ncbi:MAG: NAD(P)-dependent oxidoreductase [Candidatus Sericytochromatia bacterium]
MINHSPLFPAPPSALPSVQPGLLILGGSGYLGRALLAHFMSPTGPAAGGWQVWQSQHNHPALPHFLDLAKPDLAPFEPILSQVQFALICGAKPSLRECFEAPENTAQINQAGPLALAESLSARGIVPVLFSSDYVFGGDHAPYDEGAVLAPRNPYGQQKSALESALTQHWAESDYLLLRLTKLYDLQLSTGSLLGEMATAWQAGRSIRAAADQIFNPLLLSDALQAIAELLRRNARGVYNLGGPEGLNRFELAQGLAQCLGVDTGLIQKIGLKDLSEPFLRPCDTRLAIDKLQRFLPDWRPVDLSAACQKFADLHRAGFQQ